MEFPRSATPCTFRCPQENTFRTSRFSDFEKGLSSTALSVMNTNDGTRVSLDILSVRAMSPLSPSVIIKVLSCKNKSLDPKCLGSLFLLLAIKIVSGFSRPFPVSLARATSVPQFPARLLLKLK